MAKRNRKILNLVPGIRSNEREMDENLECDIRLPSKCKYYEDMSVGQRQPVLISNNIDRNIITYSEMTNVTPMILYDSELSRQFKDIENLPSTKLMCNNKNTTPSNEQKIEHYNKFLEENKLTEEDEISYVVFSPDNISNKQIFQLDNPAKNGNDVLTVNEKQNEDMILPFAEESTGKQAEQDEPITAVTVRNLNEIHEYPDYQPEKVSEDENDVLPLAKKKRIKDHGDRIKASKQKHPIGAPCKNTCIRKCTSNISEEQRQIIWNSYWEMDIQRRRDFISRNVENNKIAMRYSKSTKRNHTYIYKLLDKRVCKTMFLRTLGYTNDQAVVVVLKANFKTNKSSTSAKVSAAPDLRGRHKPKHALSDQYVEDIDNFIELFHPTTSHYRLEHAPNRRYLPSGLTLSQMFLFLKAHLEQKGNKPCSWATFHKRIQLKNISTQQPMQDKCPKCEAHDVAHPKPKEPRGEGRVTDHLCHECNCKVCIEYPQHLFNKNISRTHMNADKEEAETDNSGIGLFTVDMQICITMPKLNNKDFFFSRKLNLFNETFAGIGKGNKPATTMLWHEGESGRKAFDVATAYYVLFIKKFCRDYKFVILYADNCNAQNKNKILYTALLRLINDYNNDTIQTIKIEYLEPGHTYMSADSVHGSITNQMNKSNNLYDLDDYIQIFKKSRKNLITHVHNCNDVMLFKNELKSVFPRNHNISKFKIVEFRRGIPNLYVKIHYDDNDFKELDVLSKTFKKEILKSTEKKVDMFARVPRKTQPEGISQQKKNDLINLLKFMPRSRHHFYENLTVNVNITEDLDKSASEIFD